MLNIWDIVILIVVAAVVGLAVFRIVSDRRKGKSCCGCGADSKACTGNCAGCRMHCEK